MSGPEISNFLDVGLATVYSIWRHYRAAKGHFKTNPYENNGRPTKFTNGQKAWLVSIPPASELLAGVKLWLDIFEAYSSEGEAGSNNSVVGPIASSSNGI